jgi:hypothetical protein
LPANPHSRRRVEGQEAAEQRGGRDRAREPIVDRQLREQACRDRDRDEEPAPDRRQRIAAKAPLGRLVPGSLELARIR